jgi:hypothetical protein
MISCYSLGRRLLLIQIIAMASSLLGHTRQSAHGAWTSMEELLTCSLIVSRFHSPTFGNSRVFARNLFEKLGSTTRKTCLHSADLAICWEIIMVGNHHGQRATKPRGASQRAKQTGLDPNKRIWSR